MPPNASALKSPLDIPTEQKNIPENRPYTFKEIQKILDLTSVEKLSLRKIAKQIKKPYSTIVKWIYNYPEVREQYIRAKETQIEGKLEEIIEKVEDFKVGKDNKMANAEVQRLRIEVDTLKWIASKLLPKTYGDHLDITSTVTFDVGGDLQKALMLASGSSETPKTIADKDVRMLAECSKKT